jgi:hypothetical protein
VQGRHSKGHQNGEGYFIGKGHYKSDFTFENFGELWLRYLHSNLSKMRTDLRRILMQQLSSINELEIVTHFQHVDMDMFYQRLHSDLTKMQMDANTHLKQPPLNELDLVIGIHRVHAETFYQGLGGAERFVSHQTCYCCLRELAENPLPCGHVLCTPCIKSYGKPNANLPYSYVMTSCPIHQSNTVFPTNFSVSFKPPLAGVRILSLDG